MDTTNKLMSGWNRGLSVVLAGMLGSGVMLPGRAEPGQVVQKIESGQSVSQNQEKSAQQLIDQGLVLFRQGNKKALEQALVKFAEAIRVSQVVDDKDQFAFALLMSGQISDDLGNKRQSITFYKRGV